MGCLFKLLLIALMTIFIWFSYDFISHLDPIKKAALKEITIDAKNDFNSKIGNFINKIKNKIRAIIE